MAVILSFWSSASPLSSSKSWSVCWGKGRGSALISFAVVEAVVFSLIGVAWPFMLSWLRFSQAITTCGIRCRKGRFRPRYGSNLPIGIRRVISVLTYTLQREHRYHRHCRSDHLLGRLCSGPHDPDPEAALLFYGCVCGCRHNYLGHVHLGHGCEPRSRQPHFANDQPDQTVRYHVTACSVTTM